MLSVKPDITIKEYQSFIKEVYGLPDDRHFGVSEMLTNVQRFAMRGIKGIRKNDQEKTKVNMMISISWSMSLMNQLHIDIEDEIWKRFPYLCSYCASCPCFCKEKKPDKRQAVNSDGSKRPKTLADFQKMFNEIYPASSRTLEHAGIHLAEEIGEFSEAVLAYRGGHQEISFEKLSSETADVFSCFMGVLNSFDIDLSKELSLFFSENCHVCKKAPCECGFDDIMRFKS